MACEWKYTCSEQKFNPTRDDLKKIAYNLFSGSYNMYSGYNNTFGENKFSATKHYDLP